MKSLLLFTLSLGLLLFTSCETNMSVDSTQKVDKAAETIAVEDVLEAYIIANETQDFALIEKIWAPNTDIILYGTDSHERLMGWTNIRNAIKTQFKLIEDTYISASDQYIKISEGGKTAWFAETLNYNFVYQGEARAYSDLRFTGVLVKMDGEWRFVQAHLSLPGGVNVRE